MTRSMTGYASVAGQGLGWVWTWEIRAVNARGLDLRPRVPDWIDGLDAAVRAAVPEKIARGSVTASLRIARDTGREAGLDREALAAAIAQVRAAEEMARSAGLSLAPVQATDLLAMRSGGGWSPETSAELKPLVLSDLPRLVDELDAMRRSEGAALEGVLEGQLAAVENLIRQAQGEAEAQRDAAPDRLRDAVDRVLAVTDAVDETRIAQEAALLAVRGDVTEELDRLRAHVSAARALLAGDGPKGRRLEFLVQEFNREANTLCSKSQSPALTRVGLDLKAAIDQTREQVQNVE